MPSLALVTSGAARLLLAGACLFASRAARAAADREIDPIYEPFRVELAALAPDGKHVAFTVRKGRGLEAHIFKTDGSGEKTILSLERSGSPEPRLLTWISSEQLAFVSSTPAIFVTDPLARAPRQIDLGKLLQRFQPRSGRDKNEKNPPPRIFPAPDDLTCLLIETNLPVSDEDDDDDPDTPKNQGIPGRPKVQELRRLNLLTGELKRIMDYDVEKETSVGATIVDRQGIPRIVYRPGAEPGEFAYTTPDPSGVLWRGLKRAIGNEGWRPLDRVLKDPTAFSFLVEAKTVLAERTLPLGFDSDPNVLFFASNLHRDTFGIYAADLRTGKRTDLALEEPGIDLVDPAAPWVTPPLVFDRHHGQLVGVRLQKTEPATRWFDAEIDRVQSELERKFPSRRVELLEWDQTRERFLARVSSLSDPGRYFVFHRADGRCVEYLRRAPTVPSQETNRAESFAFVTPAGIPMTGYLTLPRTPAKTPPAVVVCLHSGPGQHLEPEYDRDAQALATLGFAVVKINYRGSTGFGLKHREALRENLDGAPIDDVLASLEWLHAHRSLDVRRVGLLGEGYGGYLALRALQLHPETFQSAVVINGLVSPLDLWKGTEPEFNADGANGIAPLGQDPGEAPLARAEFPPPGKRLGSDPIRILARWLVSRQSGLGSISVARHPELLTKPIFLLHDPDNREAPPDPILALRATLRRQKKSPEYLKISDRFASSDSAEHIDAYRRIGDFLNLTLYAFKVKIGEATEKN